MCESLCTAIFIVAVDPGQAMRTLFRGDQRCVLKDVSLLLARSQLEFDGALPLLVCQTKFYGRAFAHARQLVIEIRIGRLAIDLDDAVSHGHTCALSYAVGFDGGDLRLAAQVCGGRKAGRRGANGGFRHLQAYESEEL